jgi:hypothetical protein
VTEKVHVERFVGQCPQRRQFTPNPVRREERTRQGSQTARIRDRRRQLVPLHAGHRRLDDRKIRLQQILEPRSIHGYDKKRSGQRIPETALTTGNVSLQEFHAPNSH